MYINLRIKVPTIIETIGVAILLFYRKKRYGYPFRKIKLTQGKFAIVDQEDYEKLNAHKWRAHSNHNIAFYAVRMTGYSINGKRKTIQMHREIMRPADDLFVDHINHDGLDNRKINLRIVTPAQNNYNCRKRKGEHSSKYKGVSLDKREKRWRADISYKCKRIHLGYFDNEEEAAKAYDEAAKELYGEYAVLNFSQTPTTGVGAKPLI
jgi:hypothetical protein